MGTVLAASKHEADVAAERTMASASAAVTHAVRAGARTPVFALTDKRGNTVTLDQCRGIFLFPCPRPI